MSNTNNWYCKESLLTKELKNTKTKTKTETKPIPIPGNKKTYNRVGINEVNEIDGIKQNKMNKDKSYEDLTKVLMNDNNFPQNFSPRTPPEHNIIYSYMYNNDNSFLSKYNIYNCSDNLIKSL